VLIQGRTAAVPQRVGVEILKFKVNGGRFLFFSNRDHTCSNGFDKAPHGVLWVMEEGVGLDLTCVVVTSPTWANPALGLLPAVLDSFHLVR
jgi:hypothetical protein